MTPESLRTDARHNPATQEEARAFVKHVESLFMPWNIEALVAGFTDDCVVRFGTVSELHGRKALREFFTARSARQRNYRLDKQFRALMGDVIANVWSGKWDDADTGARMRGYGVESWVMRDGKIAVWEAAFNVARADAAGGVGEMLR